MASQDPRKKYSNADFPKQEQPVPGLQKIWTLNQIVEKLLIPVMVD